MADKGRPVLDQNYFVLPSKTWILFGATTTPFIMLSAYNPDLIPASLGVVRTASFYLANNYPTLIWLAGITIPFSHTLESLYAAKLCSDAGLSTSATLKWVISTFLFGYGSLMAKLKPYVENTKRPQP